LEEKILSEEEKKEGEKEEEEEEEKEETKVSGEGELLLSQDVMLSAGIHIGTRMKTKDMDPFIYRVRPDGLFVLDVKKTDERIRVSAKFLARFEPSKIAAVAARLYGQSPVEKFCEVVGATPIIGRFVPGLLSNPLSPKRVEPNVLILSDPKADVQAVKEAADVGIPVVALCSTDNDFSFVDLAIPTNNKGRRALAVIYWLLARQIMRERGEIKPDGEISQSIDDFEVKMAKEEWKEEET
jgi:small subunit ribosomal protein S2